MAEAYFLVGPTASGKTAVAHYLAGCDRMAILSADSMLVYRGMDIGTAKPTQAERESIPYFGIDLASPNERFSVGAYLDHAVAAFARVKEMGCDMIVAGGTGLYVKCLTEGLDKAAAADPVSRARATGLFEEEGVEGLQRALNEADPVRYATLRDPYNPRRLIRALELAWKGEPLNRSWEDKSSIPFVGLKVEPDVLLHRIRKRVRTMYNQGLIEEAERLKKLPYPLSDTSRHAIGYAEAFDVLENRMNPGDAMEITIRRTRRLAKRQMTWFRHQAHVEWVTVDAEEPVESIAHKVAACWEKYGRTPVYI